MNYRPQKAFRTLVRKISRKFRGNKFLLVSVLLPLVILVSALSIYWVERNNGEANIASFADAVWWSLVTITTVGYGDRVPVTGGGRLIGGIILIFGLAFFSVFTALMASLILERQMRASKGLSKVNMQEHIIVCGWNNNLERILDGLLAIQNHFLAVVMINELAEDKVHYLLNRFIDLELKFVRGDFTLENVLKKANAHHAQAAIILADSEQQISAEQADGKTIIAANTLRYMNPNIHISAELKNINNQGHLQRLEIDDIFVDEEYGSRILATSTVNPGITLLLKEMLSFTPGKALHLESFPAEWVGKPFGQAFTAFRQNDKILIAIFKEEVSLSLEDILSDGSAIDSFIRHAFEKAAKDMTVGKEQNRFLLNPKNEYIITENDLAVVIG